MADAPHLARSQRIGLLCEVPPSVLSRPRQHP